LLKFIYLHISFNYFPTQDRIVGGTLRSFILSLIFDSHTTVSHQIFDHSKQISVIL